MKCEMHLAPQFPSRTNLNCMRCWGLRSFRRNCAKPVARSKRHRTTRSRNFSRATTSLGHCTVIRSTPTAALPFSKWPMPPSPLGWKYLGVSRPTRSRTPTRADLHVMTLCVNTREIVALNERFEADGIDFRVLHGIEADILPCGPRRLRLRSFLIGSTSRSRPYIRDTVWMNGR
jgi:hypothetical protein